MDSDEEHDMDHVGHDGGHDDGHNDGHESREESSSEQDQKCSTSAMSSLTGFLFGNIDEKGELEEDFLDEESKRHLSSLTQMGIGSMVKEIADEVDVESEQGETAVDYDKKSPTAVDFSDITETADEETDLTSECNELKDGQDNNGKAAEEEDDRKLMPPPSWLPCPTQPISINTDGGNTSASGLHTSVAKISTDEQVSPSSISPSKKLNTPLADMMPPELANVDVTSLFPEFRHGQVLRFSRLFKPAHVPHVWRKKRKKKEEEDDKKDGKADAQKEEKGKDVKDGEGEKDKKADEKKEEEKKEDSSESEEAKEKVKEEIKDEPKQEHVDVTVEDVEEELELKLNFGREPKEEELMIDDEELLKRPMDLKSSKGHASHSESDQDLEVAPWRYGPAQYWYDYLGVDETGQGFQYEFKLKPEEVKKEEEEESERLDRDLDYDRYLMVTQQKWEDKIIWNGEEAKQRVLEEHKKNAEFAGWVPSTNNRTFAQSRSQSGLLQRSRSILSKPEMELGKDGEWYSIFPVENEALIYKNWEDDIIWDAENMDSLPSPKVLTLDPNDENIILEIPDDVDPTLQVEQGTGTKKEKVKFQSQISFFKYTSP